MKNKMTLILIALILISCDNSTPIVNGKDPFIVTAIKDVGDGMCKYTGCQDATFGRVAASPLSSIVTTKGMFNIGDSSIL